MASKLFEIRLVSFFNLVSENREFNRSNSCKSKIKEKSLNTTMSLKSIMLIDETTILKGISLMSFLSSVIVLVRTSVSKLK